MKKNYVLLDGKKVTTEQLRANTIKVMRRNAEIVLSVIELDCDDKDLWDRSLSKGEQIETH